MTINRHGINMVQEKHHIGSGNGYLLMGPAWDNLQDMGSLEGNSSIIISREYLDVFDGQPLILIDKHVIREGARIQCTLKEKRLRDIAWQLGLLPENVIESETATTVVAEVEQKVLFNVSWVHLKGRNISAVTVKDYGATPTTYQEGEEKDYVYHAESGQLRRTVNSTIPDGGRVLVTYTHLQPDRKVLKFGQDNSISANKVRFVYTQNDGSRQITDFHNALAAEAVTQAYSVGGLNTRDLVFDALADVTMPVGERLYRQYHENAIA